MTPPPPAPVFAALGDPTRLAILLQLKRGKSLPIRALTPAGATRQAVTKHLSVLANAGLVRDRKQGRERVFEVNPEPLWQMSDWIQAYRQEWEDRFDRLDLYLSTLQPESNHER